MLPSLRGALHAVEAAHIRGRDHPEAPAEETARVPWQD